MAKSVQDYRNECYIILRDEYPLIKDGIYRLEVFMRQKSKKAIYELRDFLDHVAMLHSDGITEEQANSHLCECRTHLRRCSVEPLEYMAEKMFVKLDRYAKIFAKIPFPIRENPLSRPEFFQRMKQAKLLIAEGRITKTEGQAVTKFDNAFSIITDLLAEIAPSRYIILGVLWLIGVFLTGVIATLVSFWLTRYFKGG